MKAVFKTQRLISLLASLLAVALLVGYWLGNNPDVYYDELLIAFAGGALIALYTIIHTCLIQPIQKLQETAQAFTKGNLRQVLPAFSEKSWQTVAEAFDHLRSRILQAAEFVKEIEKGNLEATYHPVADGTLQGDTLRSALLSMREQMQRISLDEQERNWSATGLTKFIDILRTNNQDIQVLSDCIISNLVTYLEANQGGLFITNQDDETSYLELVACYAYERKRYQQKQVAIGEGLVGQVFLEKEYLYLKDVPDHYVHITSGLGQATPRSLLIVPLMVNEVVYGVLEIASFREFADFQIVFLQKLGENIASTLANVRAGSSNQVLLAEMQQQAEEMRATEEEMRQNVEELKATQEHQERLQRELKENEALLESKILELEEAQQETVRVKELENRRASEQIAKRNQLMVKAQEKFKKREQELIAKVEQQEEALIQFKNK